MTENVDINDSLEMSDEEFLNSPPPSSEPEQVLDHPAEEEDDQQEEQSQEEYEEDSEESDDTPDEEADVEAEVESEAAPSEAEGESAGDGKEDVDPKPKRKLKAQTELDELYKPFKANGKEMAIKSVDEARRLMQQGLNYQKNMEKLKPHKRIIQTLEKKGIDEVQLNYALDILDGKPEAIAKLVQQHNLQEHNFYDEAQYQPQDHLVSEDEVRVREVFDDIQTSPHYQRVVDLISTGWDTKSAQEFVRNPSYISTINHMMETGEYDTIVEHMDRERTINGSAVKHLSDLELYCAIGESLQKQGQLAKPSQPAAKTVVAPKPGKQKNQQPQVSASKIAPTVKQAASQVMDKNWLEMSDEEMLKLKR